MSRAGRLALAACSTIACGPTGAADSGSVESGTSEAGDSTGTTGEPGSSCVDVPNEPGGALLWATAGSELGLTGVTSLVGPRVAPLGGFAIAGSTPAFDDTTGRGDAWIALLESDGIARWRDHYAGAQGLADRALDVAVDAAGNVHTLVAETILEVLAESSTSLDARLVVLRHGPDGRRIWRWQQQREPVSPWQQYLPEGQLGIAHGTDVVIVRVEYGEPLNVLTLDPHGNPVSEIEVDRELSRPTRTVVDENGGLALGGTLEEGGTPRPWVARFDDDGALAWEATFGTLEDDLHAVAPLSDGGAIVSSMAIIRGESPSLQLRRYAEDGRELWVQNLETVGSEGNAIAIAEHCDDGLLVGGSRMAPPDPELAWDNHGLLWVARLDASGQVLWNAEHEFGPPYGYGGANGLTHTREGDVLVVGNYLGDDGSTYEPWVGRFRRGP